ncbi:MAG: hypothetical protein GXY23_15785 [Myxococcales bacterium]|nr:hypothetical protein [Myxococcales bacterium]
MTLACAREVRADDVSPPDAVPPPPPRSVAGIDVLRLGFPSGIGLGFRGFPIPELALEAGAETFGLFTSLELAVAALPIPGGPDRKVQPVVRVGYRKMFVHETSDRVVRGALPRSAHELADELALHGARLDMLSISSGLCVRFRRPVALELSVGYLAQVGSTRANGGREAIEMRSARFFLGDIRLTWLLHRRRAR